MSGWAVIEAERQKFGSGPVGIRDHPGPKCEGLETPTFSGANALASAALERDLCNGGNAPFLQQLKTSQDGPDWQCGSTHGRSEFD